jgi:hypothetical protein
MKVIQKGRTQTGWAKELVCSGAGNHGGGCGAILMVEQGDLFNTFIHSRDEREVFVTFRCSECGVLTDTKDFPKGVSFPTKDEWFRAHVW